jgi:hypothetical protein
VENIIIIKKENKIHIKGRRTHFPKAGKRQYSMKKKNKNITIKFLKTKGKWCIIIIFDYCLTYNISFSFRGHFLK